MIRASQTAARGDLSSYFRKKQLVFASAERSERGADCSKHGHRRSSKAESSGIARLRRNALRAAGRYHFGLFSTNGFNAARILRLSRVFRLTGANRHVAFFGINLYAMSCLKGERDLEAALFDFDHIVRIFIFGMGLPTLRAKPKSDAGRELPMEEENECTGMTTDEMQRFFDVEAKQGASELEAYRKLMRILGTEFPSKEQCSICFKSA